MAIKAQQLGPGSLKFGETGSEIEFAVMCKSVTVEPDYDEGDTITVLSGDTDTEGDTESYTLSGELYQEYSAMSLLVWCRVNAGAVVPFKFKPDNDSEFEVRGEVRVRALTIGGDVKEKNTSDFEFPSAGDGIYKLFSGEQQLTSYQA